MIGRTISHYEIVEELGRGGMGEVYRARDTKLGRDVAIKVLPEEFSLDKERSARFEREARLLASLNHPNIASIYGLEEAGGVKAIVLELVEGPTLAERIGKGAIPVDEALAIGRQILDALEAAHADGIIHRDLKPANVKLTENGRVKVLDLGLAKALDREGREASERDTSQSPTLTREGTAHGVILGTAAYMSPEQAKGKRVDRQADVWAFGAVLYEMLTARKAFPGEDVSDTLAAVLRAEPDWSALPTTMPEPIRQVLRLCLSKERRGRLQAAGDVRLALDGAFASVSPPAASSSKRTTGVIALALALAFAFAFALGSAITGVSLMSFDAPEKTAGPVVRFAVPLPESRGGPAWSEVAMDPNGTRMAFRVGNDLYVRAMQQLEAARVTEGELARAPFFSPDGEWLGFFDRGQLKKLAVSGRSPPIVLCDVHGRVSGATWDDSDTIVFAQNPGGIYGVSGGGGEPELLIPLSEDELAQLPQLLPGGNAVLFSLSSTGSAMPESTFLSGEARIVAQSLLTGERRSFVDHAVGGRYLETGHLVYFREGSVTAMAFDPSSLQVHGPSVPLVENVAPWATAQFGVSRDGALVFIDNDRWRTTKTPVWVDQEGRQEGSGLPPGVYSALKISPDGTKVAVESRQDANTDVWIYDLVSGASRRFTFDPGSDGYPLWTPDGERIVFRSEQGGGGIFWKRSDGAGESVRVTPPNLFTFPHAVTPDGARVLLNIFNPSSSYDIAAVALDEAHAVEPLLEAPHGERRPSLSPDGRWLAYQSDETGEDNIFVSPFPDVNGGRWQISIGGGTTPIWAPDGRAVFYTTERAIMRVDLRTEPTIAPSAPVLLFQGSYFLNVRAWDVAPDGERFLMLERSSDETLEVHVVLNWTSELNARVPTRR